MADTQKNVENKENNEHEGLNKHEEPKEHENISLNAIEEKENKDEKNNKIRTENRNTETKHEPDTEPHRGKPDLHPTKAHYKTFTKTTLPHVLTEYGLEDEKHSSKKKEKVKKKKKRREQFYDEEEDARQQRKAREEKFRQNYGDNRQTDQYYQEYLEFLEKKVIKQRLKLQKEREEEERRAREREEEERQNRILQRRRSSVPLKHDDKYLQSLPKTDIFRIIELQDRMKKEGKLKTQTDIDKFWHEITQPEVFYAQFKVHRSGEPIVQPGKTDDLTKVPSKSEPSVDLPPRSLSHISEASRSEQPTPWAITQQYQSQHGARSATEKSKKGSAQAAREAALDLERRCPRLEMPPLSCFSLNLGEKPLDPEEIKRMVEIKAHEKHRKKYQRKLRKMHQLAMANAAATNRILAQRGDLTQILEGNTLRDLLKNRDEVLSQQGSLLYVYEEPESAVRYPAEMTGDIQIYPGEMSSLSSRPSSYKSSTSSHRHTPIGSDTSFRSGSDKVRRKKKLSLEVIQYPVPPPLTYNQLEESSKVLEAKCLSTNWTNYMHAGKSVFTPM